MKWVRSVIVSIICISITGCASLTVGTDKNPPQVKSQGLLNCYLAFNGFRPFDGKILEAGLFSENNRWGHVASLDIWPIGGIGVSLIGAKVKLLPFEAGLGVLGYNPTPEIYIKRKHKENRDNEEVIIESED